MINWITRSSLLEMTVDDKLTWLPHVLELKKIFANKLNLVKKSRFFLTFVCLDLYFELVSLLWEL